jgi:hypothetical protein
MEQTCVYYDDGWPGLTCVCGERAAVLTDDDAVLVPVDTPRPAAREHLPISA